MDVLEDSSTSSQQGEKISNGNNKNNTLIKEVWTYHHEKIFIEWADKAMCYRWLHNSAHIDYKCYNTWFTIPVICISTVTGTANFAQERFQDDMKSLVQIAIGSFNIIAAILTTVQQFLKISELNEAHRVSSLLWGKFYRDIKVEMAKSPSERNPPSVLLKHCKNEYDRLMEVSPIIPQFTITNFKETFSGKRRSKTIGNRFRSLCCVSLSCNDDKGDYMVHETEDDDESGLSTPMNSKKSNIKNRKLSEKEKIEKMKMAFEKIHKPEICDELVSTEETRFKLGPNDYIEDNSVEIQLIEARKQRELIGATFVNDFSILNGREPTFIEFKDGVIKSIQKEFIKVDLYNKSVRELKGPVLA